MESEREFLSLTVWRWLMQSMKENWTTFKLTRASSSTSVFQLRSRVLIQSFCTQRTTGTPRLSTRRSWQHWPLSSWTTMTRSTRAKSAPKSIMQVQSCSDDGFNSYFNYHINLRNYDEIRKLNSTLLIYQNSEANWSSSPKLITHRIPHAQNVVKNKLIKVNPSQRISERCAIRWNYFQRRLTRFLDAEHPEYQVWSRQVSWSSLSWFLQLQRKQIFETTDWSFGKS